MPKLRFSSKKALSLIEVLVAASVIAVAMYGAMLAFGAQKAAHTANRQRSMIKTLHYQLVYEVLNAERNPIDLNYSDSLAATTTISNPALGNNNDLSLEQKVVSLNAGAPPYVLESVVSWTSPMGSAQSHAIRAIYLP